MAESCLLRGIVGERLHFPTDKGSNASGKVAAIVAGMLTGDDLIELRRCWAFSGLEHHPGLLGGPVSGRVCSDTEDVHSPGRDVDDEQYVEPAQGDGVDVECDMRSHVVSECVDWRSTMSTT